MKKISLLFLLQCGILLAQEPVETQKDTLSLKEININGTTNKYHRQESTTVSKMPLRDIENPQVYNSIPSAVLKEQAVTTFNDALKNATGITRLWESTGRGGDGAEYYSIRGFAVQPTMINGLPALNMGTIDPVNIDAIEVIKGPSGTLFGSSLISYGGLVNIVTKRPYTYFGGEVSYFSGSYGLDRVTADINIPLSKDNVFMRINTAYQNEDSFQDAGFSKSIFFAPTLHYIVDDRLSFLINTEISSRESAVAPMLFLNRNSALSFSNLDLFEANYFRSFTSDDLTIKNPTFSMQAQMFYKLSPQWTSQTALSRGVAKSDGYYHYLFDNSNGDEFNRWISKRNGQTVSMDLQQNFIGDFMIGKFRNRVVAGLDYFRSDIRNSSAGWVFNGVVSLIDGNDTGDLTQAGVDNLLAGTFEGNDSAVSEVYSAYVSDVFNITPALSAMVSLRVDHFRGKAMYAQDDIDGQTTFSPKFGVVYQPILDRLSVFANYMNGFMNLAPQDNSVSGGTGLEVFDPEHANQYEFGVKVNFFNNRLSATASYYNIQVKDKLMADPENPLASIQGGEVESKGFELSVIANPIPGLNLIAGFSHNEAEVTKDAADSGYLGMRPEEAGPETLANFWVNYTFPAGSLKGLGIGFGGNHASEHLTLNRSNIGTFELPAYTIMNTALSYNVERFGLTLKLNNITNEKYYSGWSTVTPQRLRSLVAGLTYKF